MAVWRWGVGADTTSDSAGNRRGPQIEEGREVLGTATLARPAGTAM